MKVVKVLFFNLFFSIALIGFIVFFIVILSESTRFIKDRFITEKVDCIRSSCLPNYENVNWAKKHFTEYSKIRFHYETPIVFKADKFNGETINIEGEYNIRRTESDKILKDQSDHAYFFGGSVIWGFGSNDKNTIPSHFQNLSGIKSYNFGESAWTSDQSLMYLIRILKDGYKPEHVIFYNGANDYDKCVDTGNHYGVLLENKLKIRFKESLRTHAKTTFKNFFSIPIELIERFKRINPNDEEEDLSNWLKNTKCNNQELQRKIATNLVKNWEIANELVTKYGGKFYAILEPHAYFSNTKMDHLPYSLKFKKVNFESVDNTYKDIEKKMKNKKYFYNFKSIFNEINDYVFIDAVHTSPNGNKISAQKIVEIITID